MIGGSSHSCVTPAVGECEGESRGDTSALQPPAGDQSEIGTGGSPGGLVDTSEASSTSQAALPEDELPNPYISEPEKHLTCYLTPA